MMATIKVFGIDAYRGQSSHIVVVDMGYAGRIPIGSKKKLLLLKSLGFFLTDLLPGSNPGQSPDESKLASYFQY